MSLWAVLLTGLVAGGASCAAVQGGLLAGLVARRGATGEPVPATGARGAVDDVAPVAGFLAGKLVSHVALGAVLGLVGGAAQLTPRARATVQIVAGVVMVLLALDLFGVHWFRRITPTMPAAWGRRVRRSSRSQAAFGPTVLGLLSVVLPCGITLSMAALAIASGSALSGAAIMGVFVLGTSPLFAALGYLARRSATAWRGRLSVLSGVAVLLTAVVSVNTGLVILDAPVTLRSPFRASDGGTKTVAAAEVVPAAQAVAAPVPASGRQRLVLDVRNTSYSPSTVRAVAGVPTELVLRTSNTRGCTRAFVISKLDVDETLPATGETVVDLGVLKKSRIGFTCGMGMYSGSIEVA